MIQSSGGHELENFLTSRAEPTSFTIESDIPSANWFQYIQKGLSTAKKSSFIKLPYREKKNAIKKKKAIKSLQALPTSSTHL